MGDVELAQKKEIVFDSIRQLAELEGITEEQQDELLQLSVTLLRDCQTTDELKNYDVILRGQ